MAEEHEQWVVGLFGGLGDKDRRQLHGLLGELKRALGGEAVAADKGSTSESDLRSTT